MDVNSSTTPAVSHYLTATAKDNGGATTISSTVQVIVTADPPPTISLVSPASGTLAGPLDIQLQATASDTGGSVSKVEFYEGATLLATVSTPPYQHTWPHVLPGTYSFTAKATDNLGGTATTAAAAVVVTGTGSKITAPTAGSQVSGPSFDVVSRSTTSSGTITKVEFFDNGQPIGTANVASPDATVTLSYQNVPVGQHTFTSRATHSSTATFTSPAVTINVVAGPEVSLAAPAPNAFYIGPATIRLAANPSNVTGIQRVEFLSGTTVIKTVTTPPYETVWNSVPNGTYQVKARAIDGSNAEVSSATATVVVATAPVLIVSPAPPSSVADNRLNVSGTVQAPRNSAILVNGVKAVIDSSGNWHADNIAVSPGPNQVKVSLATIDAANVEMTYTVSSTAVAPFEIFLSEVEGIASFQTELTFSQRSPVAYSRIEFDYDGNGTPDRTDFSLPGGELTIPLQINVEGVYPVTVKVFDSSNAVIYQAVRHVLARSTASFVSLAQGEFIETIGRLSVSDITGAVRRFTPGTQTKIEGALTRLGATLPTIVGRLGTISEVLITDSLIEVEVERFVAGNRKVFPVPMIQGRDGLWRFDGM